RKPGGLEISQDIGSGLRIEKNTTSSTRKTDGGELYEYSRSRSVVLGPLPPSSMGKVKPLVLKLSRVALAKDEVFLILVFIYSEIKRQEKMNSAGGWLVGVQAERITNVSSRDFPGHYPGEDHAWDLSNFKKNLTVKVQRLSQHSIDFDIGVDASIANAFRRIMIAEVPTVCIEQVFVWNNNSVIVDEVLSHRIGLVPLNVDPALMTMRGPNDQPTDRNTIVFSVDVTCERNPNAPKGSTNPHELTKEVSVDEENVRNDTVSREVLRHPEFAGSVELSRVRDYFLFNVESEGPYAPERMLPEAIKVMREKLAVIRQAAEALQDKSPGGDADVVMADS
ncbi:DNA-directed RNA polymerase, partial [Gymnopilus junonius]